MKIINIFNNSLLSGWFGIDTGGNSTFSDINSVMLFVISALVTIRNASAFLAVILIVYAGFLYITSGGDEEKYRKAQGTLTSVIIGLVIIFLSALIITFVINTVTSGAIKT